MKAVQSLFLSVVCAALYACVGDRHIDFDSALRSTSQGEFTLIVFTDQFISFQKDGFHKYQYYFTPPLADSEIARIKEAVEQARAKKHDVQMMDSTKLHRIVPNS